MLFRKRPSGRFFSSRSRRQKSRSNNSTSNIYKVGTKSAREKLRLEKRDDNSHNAVHWQLFAMETVPATLQVYIVEDSPIIRRLLVSTIEAIGAELVGQSSNAQTAIGELSALDPDLILIDIILDVGSGFDVLRAIQERSLAPAAIKAVLTNHTTAEYEALSYRLGAHRFFDKGSETSQVLALIDVLSMEKRRKTMAPSDAGHSHARTRGRY